MTDSAPTTLQDAQEDLGDLLLEVLPPDGTSMGNQAAREALSRAAERQIGEDEYQAVKEKALALGLVRKGRGRGGSIALGDGIEGGARYEAPAATSGNGQGRAKKEAPTKDFKAVLKASANKLRGQMDAAEYKHLVLGLIFLKYISDTFVEHQQKVLQMVGDPESDYYLGDDPVDHQQALDDRDYYTQENVFWVPADARWESLRARAKQPEIGQLIDRALVAIENENQMLRGKLDKRFGAAQLEPGRMGQLVDLISQIGFKTQDVAKDVLGEVYEYFLGEFAVDEGKKAGQFYTPAHVVQLLVEVLAPRKGRVYDPCCGSGGMFVQSERFIESHGGRRDDISVFGQESNPTTWRLAMMNLAIRGIAADLGEEPRDTFASDQHPDQKFDYILANPHFNDKDWSGEKYDNDPRWVFGRPPVGNANYAWLQHILWKLRPGGEAGVVLSNNSMNSTVNNEDKIREAMVRGDVVEVMVVLPGQIFRNTGSPACLWFLSNDKTKRGRDRRGQTLFIDARQMGSMVSRVERVLTDEDIAKIAKTVHSWRGEEVDSLYKDIPGFCFSASIAEIEKKDFILNPGHYVETANQGVNTALIRSTTEILEGIAKALFKSWFVDFDPVQEKREGFRASLPSQIWDLFPSTFENSELGDIPSGWEVSAIGDFLEIERNSLTPADYPEEVFDHYSIPAYDQGFVPALEVGDSIKSDKYLVNDGVFLVSKLNPRFPRVWIPSDGDSRRRICSTEFLVCRPKRTVGVPFSYCLSMSDEIVQQMSDLASGTSNSHQRVRPTDFTGLLTVRPPDSVVEVFSQIVDPILRRILLERDKNRLFLSHQGDSFKKKMSSMAIFLANQQKEAGELDAVINQNLKMLGFM